MEQVCFSSLRSRKRTAIEPLKSFAVAKQERVERIVYGHLASIPHVCRERINSVVERICLNRGIRFIRKAIFGTGVIYREYSEAECLCDEVMS